MPRPDEDDFDDQLDDDRPRRRRRDDEDDEDDDRPRRRRSDDGVSSLIPYRNAQALVGYYVGVFSLIPCAGLVLGPAALVLGILGLRYAKRYPSAKGTGHAITALVLGGLTTLGNWGGVIALVAGGLANKF